MTMAFESLRFVRDKSALSARNSSKGALINEVSTIFQAISNGLPVEKIRRSILDGELVLHSSYETRRSIWNHINRRYLSFNNNWVIESLAEATKDGINSPSFLSLAYLYYVLRDKLTYKFVTGPLWERWNSHIVGIDRGNVIDYLEEESKSSPVIDKWYDSTKWKLASNMLSALRDFGVLRGINRKRIQKPSITLDTIFHLLCILMAEGLRGQQVIDAPDWHMFLFNEVEVSHHLNELSIHGWIGFEKTGRIVIMELKKYPGVRE